MSTEMAKMSDKKTAKNHYLERRKNHLKEQLPLGGWTESWGLRKEAVLIRPISRL